MSISARQAAVIGGAAFGGYTSDITENPLTGVVSTFIGAGVGNFLKLPEADLRSMVRTPLGPKVQDKHLFDKWVDSNLRSVFSISDRTNLVNSIQNLNNNNTTLLERINSLNPHSPEAIQKVRERNNNYKTRARLRNKRYEDKIEKKIVKLESQRTRLNEKAISSLNWREDLLKNYEQSLSKRADFLENKLLPKAIERHNKQTKYRFDKAVRKGFVYHEGNEQFNRGLSLRVPKYANSMPNSPNAILFKGVSEDQEMVDSLEKWLSSPKNKQLNQDVRATGLKLADNKIKANPQYYQEQAQNRVYKRANEKMREMKSLYSSVKDLGGFSLTESGRLEFDKKGSIPTVTVTDSNGNVVATLKKNSKELREYQAENKTALALQDTSKSMNSFAKLGKEWNLQKGREEANHRLLSFNEHYDIGGEKLTLSEINQNILKEYNKNQWYVEKALTTDTFVNSQKERTRQNMARGFALDQAAPDFVRDAGDVDEGSLRASIVRKMLEENKLESLSVEELNATIRGLREPSNLLKTLRENTDKSHRAKLQDSAYYFEKSYDVELQQQRLRDDLLGFKRSTQEEYRDYLERKKVEQEIREEGASEKREKLQGYVTQNKQVIQDKIDILKSRGIGGINTEEDLIEFIKNSENKEALEAISKNGVNLSLKDVVAHKLENNTTTLNSGSTEELVNWFQNQLGNDIEDAERKANMFLKRFAPDSLVTLTDGTISFVDKVDEKRVTIPLTAYKDGVRYHNAGNGVYNTVTQFNPYGAAYSLGGRHEIDGVLRELTVDDVLKGYDPEELISFIDENTSLKNVEDRVNSLFHYDSKESGIRSQGAKFDSDSHGFAKSQGMLDFSHTLNYNIDGKVSQDYPIRNLTQTSKEALGSERARLLTNLSHDVSPDISAHFSDGVSMNSLNTINRLGHESITALAPKERNESGVGFRDTEIVNKNNLTNLLEESLGFERFDAQYKSSQVARKLDVFNVDSFNRIASRLYGSDAVLADGGGFFNMGLSDDFTIRDTSTLKLPLVSDITMADRELAERLKKGDISRDNPQRIQGKIAYDTKGRPIGLNSAYSYGNVVDVFSTEEDIKLVVDSVFNPSEERNMKYYSVAYKSMNTGLTSGVFDTLGEIGDRLNRGVAIENSDGSITYNGTKMTLEGFQKAIQKEITLKKSNNSFVSKHLIGAADGTGSADIKRMMETKSLAGTKIYDSLISKGISNTSATFTSMLLSDSKAAVDLATSVRIGIGLNDRANISTLDSLLSPKSYVFGADNTSKYLELNKLVEKSGILPYYLNGSSYTVGSINKGQSVVGTGNIARMSWNAVSNLKQSGFTDGDFDFFAKRNKDVLYEIRGMVNERKKSSLSFNKVIEGTESDFLTTISSYTDPERRMDKLRSIYNEVVDPLAKNPYITYNLSSQDHEIKSINFSRISTNRSGFFKDSSGISLLKQLDGKRLSIISADLEYKNTIDDAKKKIKKEALDKLLDDYVNLNKSIFSGNNNILKDGLSLVSETSDIMQIRGIGGQADDFAKKLMETNGVDGRAWFISKEEATHKAKQLGGELKYKKTSFSNIFEPVVVRDSVETPLASLVTREPAQGPLSSDLIHWYVDNTLLDTNKGNAFVPLSDKMYFKGMFGDMDQDTVQTLLGDFNTRKDFETLNNKRVPVRKSFEEMIEILDKMKVKGSATTKSKAPKSLEDFSSEEELSDYHMRGALKGRHRKVLAAPVTGLALAYTKALEMELGTDEVNVTKKIQSRMLVHQLVENLIKTAHIETSSFNAESEQAVEKLVRMRSGFLNKKGYEPVDSNSYSKALREELPKFLNLEGIDTTTPGGALMKKRADALLETVIQSELKHSSKIGNNPFSPLDLPEHRFSKNSSDWINSIQSILENQLGASHMDFDSPTQNPRKAVGRFSSKISEFMSKTLSENKMLIGGGLAAMAGVSLLGRSEPTFNESRADTRQYAASMLKRPEPIDRDQVPMGIETNTNKAGYMLPKMLDGKAMRVAGDFVNNSYNASENFTPSNVEDQLQGLNEAVFGGGIRTATFQSN